MDVNNFHVQAPWRIEDETLIDLTVHNRQLLGSRNHFLRFDLYPIFAPAHPERHFGYWDIPMNLIGKERTKLLFRHGNLMIPGLWRSTTIKPIWTGNSEPLGYCRLQVSCWDCSGDQPVQNGMMSSEHLFIKDGKVPPFEYILMPISQRCNLFCPFCTRQHGADLDESDLPADVFNAILEAAPHAPYIGLQGIGEPLLNKNLVTIVKDLRNKMPTLGRLALTTNGTLLDEGLAARLIDAGLNTITFSIDGATKPVYESKRVGADFDRVISNISGAVNYGKKTGREDLWFTANFIIMHDNVHEMSEFVRVGANLGIDCISFFQARQYPNGQVAPIDEGILTTAIAEAKELGKRNNVTLKFANPRRSEHKSCLFMQGVYLWLSGEVLPCHRMEPPGHPWPVKNFGNVLKNPLLDIWDRAEYREFRARVLKGDQPDVCLGCTFNNSVTI